MFLEKPVCPQKVKKFPPTIPNRTKILTLVALLSQKNLVLTLQYYFFTVHFILSFNVCVGF